MKLEKYVDKIKRKKIILISISSIVLIGFSFLLYKTFANFSEEVEFSIMNGKVDYFGNSDVYFAFYNENKKLEEMPGKDNSENLVFDYGECDNGASIEWNNEEWAPIVKDLVSNKTKCTLYFKEKESIKKCQQFPNSAICYLTKLGDSDYNTMIYDRASANGIMDNNLRYIGANPNNYVLFNEEIWRIIGVIKVETESGAKEDRVKIIRQDGIANQTNFGSYRWDYKSDTEFSNNWTTSSLKDMLNGIYYNSDIGSCNKSWNTGIDCDFKNGQVKGLNETARKMVDKDINWSIGGCETAWTSPNNMYKCERGEDSKDNQYPSKWTKENDKNYHNGVGLMYVSDYGYATDGGNNSRNECFNNIILYSISDNSECVMNNWLKTNTEWQLALNYKNTSPDQIFYLQNSGKVDYYRQTTWPMGVWPVVYLKSTVKINTNPNPEQEYGSINNPFVLSEI